MQKISLFIALLIVCAFKPAAIEKNRDLQVVSASMQTSYGGAAGSGSATTYRVKLKVLRPFMLNCDSGFAQGKADAFVIVTDTFTQNSSKQLKKGEIIELVLSIRDESSIGGGDFQMVIPGSPTAELPKKTKGTLVIRYKGGKCKTLSINKLTKIEPIIAP
jgi:hypothetical protein